MYVPPKYDFSKYSAIDPNQKRPLVMAHTSNYTWRQYFEIGTNFMIGFLDHALTVDMSRV